MLYSGHLPSVLSVLDILIYPLLRSERQLLRLITNMEYDYIITSLRAQLPSPLFFRKCHGEFTSQRHLFSICAFISYICISGFCLLAVDRFAGTSLSHRSFVFSLYSRPETRALSAGLILILSIGAACSFIFLRWRYIYRAVPRFIGHRTELGSARAFVPVVVPCASLTVIARPSHFFYLIHEPVSNNLQADTWSTY